MNCERCKKCSIVEELKLENGNLRLIDEMQTLEIQKAAKIFKELDVWLDGFDVKNVSDEWDKGFNRAVKIIKKHIKILKI